MGDDRLVITEAGFLTEFLNQHSQRTDRPFCFIIGAGVSRSSGIATGGEMAKVWLHELYEAENFAGLSLEAWATAEQLSIEGFTLENLARFYPQLYQRRFGDYEQAGYAFLESQMEGKEPSYGYSVLSYLLSETAHRVVVTTNFDNLVADALSIHSNRFPLVIGHDTLAQYAAVELRRPLVAKIHGALGFSPKSHPDDISDLPQGWRVALARILDRYTPIVIGYEGNDGSLMGFLKSLQSHIPDRIFWCVYAPDAKGSECLQHISLEVREYVQSRRGRFVPIRGFDELMAKLLTKLREKGSVPDLYQRLQDRARQRERIYDEQQRRLADSAVEAEPLAASRDDEPVPRAGGDVMWKSASNDVLLKKAVSEIVESRKDKPWWSWANEAKDAKDDETARTTYLQGLEALPNSVDLLRDYALFLEIKLGDAAGAEEIYKRALKIDPNDAHAHAFYGNLLIRTGRPDMAEEHILKAVELQPADYYFLTIYAIFLHRVRKDMDKAEEFYERAVKFNPNHEFLLKNYANFLRQERNNPARAEELERRIKSPVTS